MEPGDHSPGPTSGTIDGAPRTQTPSRDMYGPGGRFAFSRGAAENEPRTPGHLPVQEPITAMECPRQPCGRIAGQPPQGRQQKAVGYITPLRPDRFMPMSAGKTWPTSEAPLTGLRDRANG